MSEYVYIESERTADHVLYTVGFYDPDGKWHPESDHGSRDNAAERVHYLNGGKPQPPATLDGYALVPRELTAKNGAKALLIGEFFETYEHPCAECMDIGEIDPDCEFCDGSGVENIPVAVSWSTIKAIHKKMVEHFAARPDQPTGDIENVD